jgi:hypothetical protein
MKIKVFPHYHRQYTHNKRKNQYKQSKSLAIRLKIRKTKKNMFLIFLLPLKFPKLRLF